MKRWYLLYCKRGEQIRAKQHLENQGVECFYPTVEVEKILRGKRQKVEEPLFPCYVFARFDYEQGPNFTSVRSTRGVVDFVRFGAQPKEVQGDLVFELKQLEKCCTEKTYPNACLNQVIRFVLRADNLQVLMPFSKNKTERSVQSCWCK